MQFGYYPEQCNLRNGDISLAGLPSLDESIELVEAESDKIEGDWIYAGPKRELNFFTRAERTLPFPARVFGLPRTHVLAHDNADGDDHLEFLIWCLGFFAGMRLTPTQAGFLDATPIRPGKLTDFLLIRCTLVDAALLADAFWRASASNPRDAKRMTGIINTLFLAQYPPYLQFEEFMYLYTALDACYALTASRFPPPRRLFHAHRLEWLCGQFGIQTPDWASPASRNSTEVSLVRNDAIHEALFFEEPLGFAIYGGNARGSGGRNIPLEMRALICRLLVAILGRPDCAYVSSPVGTRQKHALTL